MPEISIENSQDPKGYGIRAEDTIWIKQGILSIKQLRDSEDEQMIADIVASILLCKPLAASQEIYDDLYDINSDICKKVENALAAYNPSKLAEDIISTFSVLKDTIESFSSERYALRSKLTQIQETQLRISFIH